MVDLCRSVLRIRGSREQLDAFARTAGKRGPSSTPFSLAAFFLPTLDRKAIFGGVKVSALKTGSKPDLTLLETVLDAKAFEIEVLGFRLSDEYTTVELDLYAITKYTWNLTPWETGEETVSVVRFPYTSGLEYEIATNENPPLAFFSLLQAMYPRLCLTLRYDVSRCRLLGGVDVQGRSIIAPERPVYPERNPLDPDGWSDAVDQYIDVVEGHMTSG